MLLISDIPNLGELQPARCWIYALVDPCSNEIRYIGCTRQIRVRSREHRNGFAVSRGIRKWLGSLKRINLKPQVFLIQEVTTNMNRDDTETYWISLCLSRGARLLNTIIRPSSQIVREAVKAELDRIEGKSK